MQEDQPAPIEITLRTSPSDAYEFLTKLARDEAFREELQADPRGIMERYGIEISEGAIPAEVELPPPEEVEELLAKIGELDEYGRAAYVPLGYGWLIVVLPLAMPIVSARNEVDDAD